MKERLSYFVVIVGVIILAVLPLVLASGSDFGGADSQAEVAITELAPSYEPWSTSIWEPPGSEIEGLLFALQAALGAGFIGYYLGYSRGRKAG